jgi:23S rRNA (cytosine1962-C5)-methyltransferase
MALHGITLPETARLRLDSGAPELRIEELALARELEPGRPIRLIDRDAAVVACGVADPENGLVRILSRQELRGFDDAFFRGRLRTSLALRQCVGLAGAGGEEAYRLVNAEGDGLPGFTADVYGSHLVISAPSRALLPLGRQLGESALEVGRERGLDFRGAVIKVRGKDPQDRSAKEEILGESPPKKLVVRERGVPFEVHLLGALNVGLFTDMREHRRNIGRYTAGRRVLNTFAYTGALSVAAALAGASAVTSVDLSTGVLAWAEENFRLSGLDPKDPRFRFEASDVRRFLERAQERKLEYDTIISTRPPSRPRAPHPGR